MAWMPLGPDDVPVAATTVVIPSTSTVPSLGKSVPFAKRTRVDLPEPFAPTTATSSPGKIENETPASAGGLLDAPAYRYETFAKSISV